MCQHRSHLCTNKNNCVASILTSIPYAYVITVTTVLHGGDKEHSDTKSF